MTALLLLAGCASPPPPATERLPIEIPASYAGAVEAAPAPELWWRDFGQPELDAVVREALEANQDLAAAAANLEAAAAQARISAAGLFPTLQANANASRSRQTFNIPGLTDAPGGGSGGGEQEEGGELISATTDTFGVSLEASWEVDLWGRVRSQASAAQAEFQAQAAQYRAAALSMAGQTAKAWFALIEAQQQVELAEATLESYRETARQAGNRAEAGVQAPTDRYLTAASAASSEALLQERIQARRETVRQLEILLGRYPAGELEARADLPELPALPPSGIPAELVSRRPDLVAAERQLAASMQQVEASRAALYPRLNLTGSTGTNAAELGNLFNSGTFVWSIAGGLVQPIFQGGELRAQVDVAQAQEREALASFAQTALDAFLEVEVALAVDGLLAERESAQRRAAENATRAREIALNRYRQGVEPLLSVLEAQRQELDAQSAAISVRRLRLDNRVDFYLALGGGYEAAAIAAQNSNLENNDRD